jgi:hypothetical protein
MACELEAGPCVGFNPALVWLGSRGRSASCAGDPLGAGHPFRLMA